MSEISRRRRRSDAERSVAAILDAALRVLGERPDAGMVEIAAAAGVTRQTVYAHFPSREALLAAVVQQVTAEVVAAIDAARLDEGPAAQALVRFAESGWQAVERFPLLANLPPRDADDAEAHQPITERLAALVRRGQRAGEFDRELPVQWLLAATIALGHAAGEQVAAGRLTHEAASAAFTRSLLKVFGAG